MSRLAPVLPCLLLAACGEETTDAAPPVTTEVRLDLMDVPGVDPPKSPDLDLATPPELNFTRVLRYRLDVDPPAPVRSLVVIVPGLEAGALSYEPLAQALVRHGAETGHPVEAWALDRRANLLEDLRGLEAGDADTAAGYYRDGQAVDGETFAGHPKHADVAYMSEWGLATHAGDLRRVLARVPEEQRKARVFLAGHSMGAMFTEAWAAWRFEDGVLGTEQIAGIVLLDGILREEPIDEAAYMDGQADPLTPLPGLNALRDGSKAYYALPLLGIEVFTTLAIQGLRARQAPTELMQDPVAEGLLGLLLGLNADALPKLTNRGALGLALDSASLPIGQFAISMGQPTGGPLEDYEHPLLGGTKQRPSDPEATYDWIDAFDADPAEYTPLATLIRGASSADSNWVEWYFPVRLLLDLLAVGGARVADGSYQAAAGLRAFDGALIDAPILAVEAELFAGRLSPIRDRVAPTLGEGRPHAGLGRDDERAFSILDVAEMSHLDVVLGADTEHNPVPAAVLDFVRTHTGGEGLLSL